MFNNPDTKQYQTILPFNTAGVGIIFTKNPQVFAHVLISVPVSVLAEAAPRLFLCLYNGLVSNIIRSPTTNFK